jgi:16S rRNA (guanine527-N7)-methyltransferase
MADLSLNELAALLEPYVSGQSSPLPPALLNQLSVYLDLLLRWNNRINLTAIRDPEEIVRRHFGESLFTGLHLASRLTPGSELLDYGSGAGFPGLPIQLLLPQLKVTLAESQAKKAAFLREVARTLSLPIGIWSKRVEEMPPDLRFGAITLRAVDRMELSLEQAAARVHQGGWMAVLAGGEVKIPHATAEYLVPNSKSRRLILLQAANVPRGTSPVISIE